MMTLLLIAIGGAIGAACRFAVSSWSHRHFHHSPIGTLLANVSGALTLGVVVGLGDSNLGLAGDTYRFMVIGVLGSYTTFSTFVYEAFALIETEKRNLALLYAAGSLVAGLIAVFLGMGAVALW